MSETNNDKEPPSRGDTGETEASSSSETTATTTTTSNDASSSNAAVVPDADLIQQAEDLYSVERLFVAADLLRKVQDKSLLKDSHHGMLRWADAADAGVKALLESPESEESSGYWKKQSESHGHRDFLVYYHVSKENELTCRIDSAIESSLLVPILSVFNESELYKTWMPSWERPIKLGIADTKKLKESGRGNQIIQVTVNMAWPFSTRETIQHAMAIDVIEEEGKLAIHVMSETPEDDPVIPEPLPGVVRIDFEASFLIGGCPPDHPCLANSKNKYPEGEELIMITMSSRVDPHVAGVPVKLINLVTRTAFGSLWSALLSVAEEVRDGKRPEHQEAIAAKRELYDFVEGRIDVMIDKVKQETAAKKESGSED